MLLLRRLTLDIQPVNMWRYFRKVMPVSLFWLSFDIEYNEYARRAIFTFVVLGVGFRVYFGVKV